MKQKSNKNLSAMSHITLPSSGDLFERVASILEQARSNVVRSVNTNMVRAYWLIGREIVQEFQSGEERAGYGKQIIEKLSARLTKRYGKGFSAPTLWNFRQFYQVYAERFDILSPSGRELTDNTKLSQMGRELMPAEKQVPADGEPLQGFSPLLSWSHYRALMRVQDADARAFYELEALECGWSKTQLEISIYT